MSAMTFEPDPDRAAETEEAALWTAFKRDGSASARERLFSRHADFARNIARRHYREQRQADIELLDLQQFAFAGLLEALDRFDPQNGAPFRPFAAHRISGSIRDGVVHLSEMREQISWRRRARRDRLQSLADGDASAADTSEAMEKLAEIAVGLALGFMLEGTGLFASGEDGNEKTGPIANTAYDSVAWKQIVTQLHGELSALPEREQTILRQHYINNLGFDDLAVLLALTKGRISQLHRAALVLLRKRMSQHGHFRLGK
jgi:RNA polymerase sigma factor FliA